MSKPVYLPPPEFCETLASLAARTGGAFTAHAAGGGEAVLEGGRVFDSGNVIAPDGRSIARDVSPDFGRPFAEHWLLTFKRIRPPSRLRGETTLVATPLGAGYGHWLLEELPRLLMLPRMSGRILAHAEAPFAREVLGRFGLLARTETPRRHGHVVCDQLVVPTLASTPGEPTAASLEQLVNLTTMGAVDVINPGLGGRLYVSRERCTRRRLADRGPVEALLASRGFREVFPEELPWAAQIGAFAAARMIVGVHGAGLANTVFCLPGTRVVELFSREFVNPVYERVAALSGLDYRGLLAPGDEAPRYEPRGGRLDVAVDLEALARALD